MVASALVVYRNVHLVEMYSLVAVKCCLILCSADEYMCCSWTEDDFQKRFYNIFSIAVTQTVLVWFG